MFTSSVLNKSGVLFRSYSLQTFDEYKERESQCSRDSAVTPEGTLLDYPDLWLRRNPPNVQIDNKGHPIATIITIDSANRPGTLVEVVQCLTELNLIIREAQISSDGGWFVDVFVVEESNGGKVIDHKKLEMIKRVLRIEYDCEQQDCHEQIQTEERVTVHTVVELADEDRLGLLYDVAKVLSNSGLDIKSLAAWTQHGRAAAVIGALAGNAPLEDPEKLTILKSDLVQLIGRNSHVNVRNIKGYIHHERCLHRLLLQEAEKCTICSELGTSECNEDICPKVTITDWPRLKYWRINIHCKDRPKLLYDILCTLADLGYEIYHATVVCSRDTSLAEKDFYIRSRLGEIQFCEKKAEKLREMLISSILRRQPYGLKIHILTMDHCGLLCHVADIFRHNNISLTRAIVKCFTDKIGLPDKHAVHTFFLVGDNGLPADASEVISMLSNHGGQFCSQLSEDRLPFKTRISQDTFAFNVMGTRSRLLPSSSDIADLM